MEINSKGEEEKDDIASVERSKEDAMKSYDKLSPYYDWWSSWEDPYRENGIKMLAPIPGEVILEIGCGTGLGLLEIAYKVTKAPENDAGFVHGLDISPKMVEVSKRRLGRHGFGRFVEIRQGDAENTGYENSMFDGVFMSFVLELFDTPIIPLVLEECCRILKGSGRLVVVGMSKDTKSGVVQTIYEWAHRKFPNTVDCRPIYVARSIRNAGFHVTHVAHEPMYGLGVEIVRATKELLEPEKE